jgi:hypothetical protein
VWVFDEGEGRAKGRTKERVREFAAGGDKLGVVDLLGGKKPNERTEARSAAKRKECTRFGKEAKESLPVERPLCLRPGFSKSNCPSSSEDRSSSFSLVERPLGSSLALLDDVTSRASSSFCASTMDAADARELEVEESEEELLADRWEKEEQDGEDRRDRVSVSALATRPGEEGGGEDGSALM